ncbi:hypothetical protein BZA70DRAFT_54184 [Myxozyma melibiosi]|uniref:Uncharacterized protein n=1 Tax=Myxozyma melibiosi TaxID=54550 RepID=A0ABR1FFE3_9ASCO
MFSYFVFLLTIVTFFHLIISFCFVFRCHYIVLLLLLQNVFIFCLFAHHCYIHVICISHSFIITLYFKTLSLLYYILKLVYIFSFLSFFYIIL